MITTLMDLSTLSMKSRLGNSLFSWFLVIVPLIQLLISIFIIILCIKHVRRERNTPKSSYLIYIALYLCTISFSKIGNLIFDLFYHQVYDADNLPLMGVIVILSMFLDIIVFVVRLLEPNIRRYLKSCWVYYKLKIKYLCKHSLNRSSYKESMLTNRPSLNVSVIFEELRLESIEYQLIALSIILFKCYTPSHSIAIHQK